MQMTQEIHTPDYLELTNGLSVLHLQFQVRALGDIHFGVQPGSQLRGALYEVLSNSFCGKPLGVNDPNHAQICPVCRVLAAEDPNARRGRYVSRPLTIEPPLNQRSFKKGEVFVFGISLIGWAQELILYIARAVEAMGQRGAGRGRGRFKLEQMSEYSPLLDATRSLLDDRTVRQPTLQVTAPRILDFAAEVASDEFDSNEVTLEMLTPTRLTAQGKLVKEPRAKPFVQRLVERCQSMMEYYADTMEDNLHPDNWRLASNYLCEVASNLAIVDNQTRWVEAHSGSRQKGRMTPISGLVGRVTWQGEIAPILPWLAWGQSLHVGKDAVKGDGWYRIIQ